MRRAKTEQTGESSSAAVKQQADSNQQTDPTNIPKPSGNDVQEVAETLRIVYDNRSGRTKAVDVGLAVMWDKAVEVTYDLDVVG